MRYLNTAALCIISVAFSASAVAESACPTAKLIFTCTTTNNKVVVVCDAGKTINYSLTKKGATPEIALSIPRNTATTHQWKGIGRSITYSVQIPNADTVYEVFNSLDKMTGEATAGINVEIAGKLAATLNCQPATVKENLEGIALKEVEN